MDKLNYVVNWIKEYFDKNGPNSKAVVGISGGKDSTIAAALCVKALGKDRVIGVRMPQGTQSDIQDAYDVCNYLGIASYEINIGRACEMIYNQLDLNLINPDNPMIQTNTPARMRTNVLYAVAAAVGGRVCCTSNRSEGYVGYTTKWGDSVGDFAPLRAFTVSEVLELGSLMNIPFHFIFKEPSDGMSGKTDEENLGFSYEDVDLCIQGLPGLVDYEKRELIKNRHFYSSHKREKIPCCPHYNKAVLK